MENEILELAVNPVKVVTRTVLNKSIKVEVFQQPFIVAGRFYQACDSSKYFLDSFFTSNNVYTAGFWNREYFESFEQVQNRVKQLLLYIK